MVPSRFVLPFSVLAAVLCAGALATCGLDEHYTGMGTGALPGDPLYPQPDATVNCPPCQQQDVIAGDLPQVTDNLAGKAFRFDTLTLDKPLSADLAALVNPVVADQIGQELINLLLVVDTDDRDGGTLAARLGTGPKPAAAGAYAFGDAPKSISLAFANPAFQSAAETTLSITVEMGDDDLVLPVQALKLSGTISVDGTTITGGVLTGAITQEDGQKVAIPLYETLENALLSQDPPIEPDTTVGPDAKPAWSFRGTFTAVSATVN